MEDSDIEIQVASLHKHPWPGKLEPRVFTRENMPDYIECSDSKCNGKISRAEIIRAVTDILNGNKVPPVKCSGNDGYRNCHRAFEITINQF